MKNQNIYEQFKILFDLFFSEHKLRIFCDRSQTGSQ